MVKIYRRSARRPRVRRSRRRMNIPRNRFGNRRVYAFKRKCQLYPWNYIPGTGWTQSNINDITNSSLLSYTSSGIFRFRLQDLPSFAEFGMFEKFKITGVKLEFHPYIGTESSTATGIRMAQLATAFDDSQLTLEAGAPSFSQVLEDQGCRLRTIKDRIFTMFVRPKTHNPLLGVAGTHVLSPWIAFGTNYSGPSVYHSGVKYAFPIQVANDIAVYYKCYATYYVKCLAPR